MNRKPVSGFRLKKSIKKGVRIEVKNDFKRMIGSPSSIRDVVKHFASNCGGFKLHSTSDAAGRMELWSADPAARLQTSDAKAIIKESDKYLKNKYNINDDRLRRNDKEKKMERLYGSPDGYAKGFVSDSSSSPYRSTQKELKTKWSFDDQS